MKTNAFSKHLYEDIYFAAVAAKDSRFDGRFFFAVCTTGVYCRPVCSARTPLRKNVRFFHTTTAAEKAGFRPCRRCRPEALPRSAAWLGSLSTVQRALKIIASNLEELPSIRKLSQRLGVGERQLRRLFKQHLRKSPVAVLRDLRIEHAHRLVTKSALPFSEIAYASGFKSIRRFNDVFKKRYLRAPSRLREMS